MLFLQKEFKISKKDINKTIQFNFDAKRPEKINYGSDYDYSQAVGNACNNICIANAFIRILDPKNNWAISNYDLKDNTNLSQSEWSNHTLKLKINEGHEGTFYKLDLRPMPLVMIIPVFIMTMSH